MVLAALFALALSQAEPPSPLLLDSAKLGQRELAVGSLTNLATGKAATVEDIAQQARGKRFVYLGEQHATKAHQQFQADMIEALVKDGRKVMVGLEMLTRPKQNSLDRYIDKSTNEAEFLAESDWKTQWGFDFAFYRPVFDVCRMNGVRMVALNVPRDWVRTVGRNGLGALPPAVKKDLPATIATDQKRHRQVFESLIGGHPMSGPAAENMYSAQVLWDEGMADTALKAIGQDADPNLVFVVIAGSGHIMFGEGINLRVARRTGKRGVNIVMVEAEKSVPVSRGLADFVLVTAPVPKK